ncbi:hypothetical protein BN1058_02534 [Paraliobacillus sp. PM-2]|uniref:hypothetical protein n=1 Tax=Paraliobacillus sp. PM-2 TaxID=1462524 RepID=UPI00061BAF46|nr:hypothetical protein [Paraliobacillus sp. PM-2]CQR48185.1 hypothetical protein BN1058_02534 [Paraliobacillus sp. PM-2]
MNNRVAGLLLIGLSLLTAVIAYSLGELIDTIKASSAHIAGVISGSGSSSLAWGGNPPVSIVPIILIIISLFIGVYLLKQD